MSFPSTYSVPALSKVVIFTFDIESPESTSENVKSLAPNTLTVSSVADRVWLLVVGASFTSVTVTVTVSVANFEPVSVTCTVRLCESSVS